MSSIEDESDNSSDLSNEDGSEKELLNRANELEAELSSNKYLYDAHVEVTNIYRQLADLNSMREAYKRFHEYFPLTPKLWLEWIKDEIKIANSKEEQQDILKLFEKAVEDYLSIDLWIEYIQYSLGVCDIQTTRIIAEKALTSAGLHVSQGVLLWDTLREIENAHVSLLKEGSDERNEQIKRVFEVFKRQLSVPLLNMEDTYEEWTEWSKIIPENLVDVKQVEWGYKKALKTLETYKPFEDRLLSADETELKDIFNEYIKVVKDPLSVVCLYERAAVTLCLSPELWIDYIKFAFKMEDVVLNVSKRSLRNCPWSEDLWIYKLRVLEFYKREEKEIITCFEEGLSNISPNFPLNFWFSFLEYYHRNIEDKSKLDKLFDKALEHINVSNDPTYKINRWYARLLAKRGDMVQVRKLWNNILAKDSSLKGSYSAWIEYANIEKHYGEINQARNIYKRALTSCKEWSSYIAEEWLMFEKEVGTLDDVIKCEEKCKMHIIPQQYNQKTTQDSKKDKEPVVKNLKRKQPKDDDFNFKKLKVSHDPEPENVQKTIEKDPKTTVFVSNLHPSVKEDDLKKLFPNALNVNIVIDRKGKSRCFGYIQFSKEEETMSALAQDRIPIDGRPVFVSELKTDKVDTNKKFKYPTETEENKIFVKNLPLTKTKDDIQDIFKSYNPVDVRLVTQKSGQSKGFAYIEFKSKEDAQKALELNGKNIDGKDIFVAISAPPPKKDKTESTEPIRHARSRLQVPMIPRTLQVKKEVQNNGNTTQSNKNKTNEDFRNLFLNK